MPTIADVRAQYPQYAEIPDGKLAYSLWNKFYKEKMPMGLYADEIKLDDDQFTDMVEAAQSSGYQPTATTFAPGTQPELSRTRAALQGATLGFSDEITGAGAALIQKARGSDVPLGELASQNIDQQRAMLDQYRKESPWKAAGFEVAGAVGSPANLISGPAALTASAAPVRAAITGAVQGAAYGAGTGEGSIRNRVENAVKVAVPSALFGVLGQQAFRLVGAAGQRLARAFGNSATRPTIESLRATKNAAYDAVDASGLTFAPRDMLKLYAEGVRSANGANYVPEVDRQTYAALRMLENQRGKTVTIGELDKLRQGLWKRLEASGGSEVAISDMIDSIDNLIQSAPATDDLMQAARLANSRYKKSEMLETAFENASRQVAATGSGGNLLNKYRQAVTSILNNPRKAKWFNEQEIATMDQFVRGGFGENVMRRIGKLSPSGNGLMLALNIGAIAADPSMMAVTAAGAAAKSISDASSVRGAENLLDTVATGVRRQPVPYIPGVSSGAASGSAQATDMMEP